MKHEEKNFSIEDAECTHSTDRALLVEADELDEPTWIPISQIREESEVREEGDAGTLVISRWLAEQKSLC